MAARPDPIGLLGGIRLRAAASAAALALSLAIPIAFLALVVRRGSSLHAPWITGVAALVAISVVIATVVLGSRR